MWECDIYIEEGIKFWSRLEGNQSSGIMLQRGVTVKQLLRVL